jgi:hypothetical protein
MDADDSWDGEPYDELVPDIAAEEAWAGESKEDVRGDMGGWPEVEDWVGDGGPFG